MDIGWTRERVLLPLLYLDSLTEWIAAIATTRDSDSDSESDSVKLIPNERQIQCAETFLTGMLF